MERRTVTHRLAALLAGIAAGAWVGRATWDNAYAAGWGDADRNRARRRITATVSVRSARR